MDRPARPPMLRVEGPDDEHAIKHLLLRHGVQAPEFEQAGGIEELLGSMDTAVKLSGGASVGFVLDADAPLVDRWRSVQARLARVGVGASGFPPPGGFVGDSADFKTRVGVWLMPDNQHDGKLETFLEGLVAEEDSLIGHARASTDAAKQLGARFSEPDRVKAVVHAWLAWQREPGHRFGTALRSRFFRHDSPAALAFVAWFQKLCGAA